MFAPHLRLIKWTLFMAILFSGFITPVSAREVPWQEMHQQSVSLFQKGKYPQALKVAQQAWKLAQNSFGPEDLRNADSLMVLASIERVLGMYAPAENDFWGALIIREKALGPENITCIECLTNLAEMELDQDAFEKAALYGERALDISKKNLMAENPDHPMIAENAVLVAEAYAGLGQFQEAETICGQALKTLEKTYGKKHPSVARVLMVTAQINYGLDPKTKIDLSDARKTFGSFNKGKNVWLGSALFLEGKINQGKGEYRRGASFYKKAQNAWEKALSPSHPLVGKAINGLASVYQAQKKYSKALSLYETAQRNWEKAFGLEHPFLAMVLYQEAEMQYYEWKKFQAGLSYHRSLVLQEKIFGPDNLEVVSRLNRLAEIYQIHGQYPEAESLCAQAIDIMSSKSWVTDPQFGVSRSLRGRIYLEQGRLGEAATEIEAALKILQTSYPDGNLELTKCLLNQAWLMMLTGKYEDAESLYKKHFKSLEKTLGPNHLYLAMILEDRASLAQQLGQMNVAQKLRKRAEKIRAQKRPKFLLIF